MCERAGAGSYFAYAGSDMTITNGGNSYTLTKGLQAKGTFNLFGGTANFAVTFHLNAAGTPADMSIAITAQPALSVKLSQIVGALDSRVSATGLDAVSFGLTTLAVTVSAGDTTVLLAGQVSLSGATVAAEVYFVQSTKAIAISVSAAAGAQAVFNAMYSKITGRFDSPFTINSASRQCNCEGSLSAT